MRRALLPRDGSSMTADSLPRAADVEHLTEALRRSGALPHGRVRGAEVISATKTLRSHTFRLRLGYEDPAAHAPDTIILKMGHLDGEGRPSYANRHEIAFYRDVAPVLPERLVPRCFEAVEARDTSAWHLLLEDLTESHFIATEWPLPPTLAQYEAIMQAQACFHAAWWDHPRLGGSVGSRVEDWDRDLRTLAEQLARFMYR